MKFDTNDLVYAYLTMQEADNDIAKFEYYCTDDDFLEKYDDLSKNQKKHFFELLEQAIETTSPWGKPLIIAIQRTSWTICEDSIINWIPCFTSLGKFKPSEVFSNVT